MARIKVSKAPKVYFLKAVTIYRKKNNVIVTKIVERFSGFCNGYVEELQFPDPVDGLKNKRKYVRKTFPGTPKSIIFNKSIMAKHPEIDLDLTTVFKSMIDMLDALPTQADCRKHLEKLRWNGEPICPHCGSRRKDHYSIKTRGVDAGRLKCKDCRLPFSVTVGTIFDKAQAPLRKWFMAVYLFNSDKKGISSLQLERIIGVTQSTAWKMLSKLRNAVKNRMVFEFEGIVQVDETYVGGKNKTVVKVTKFRKRKAAA